MNTLSNSLSAAILAGGRSSRMGRNKALLRLQGRLVIDYVISAARQVAREVFLVTNQADEFAFLHLPMYPDDVPGLGPIGGLATALRRSSDPYCLILACDLPLISPEALAALVQRTETQARAIVLDVGRGPEPLCGLYSRASLPDVQAQIDAGDLKLQDLLRRLDAEIVHWPHENDRILFNLNTPSDFQTADALLQQPSSAPSKDRLRSS